MPRILLLLIAVLLASVEAEAKKRTLIAGPVMARVLKIYDGDTIEVLAQVWPGHQINVKVRIRGIDAPEIRAKCADERRAAINARNQLRMLIDGGPVWLSNISGGKYFGRVLADVETKPGQDMETMLLESGLVRPYRGKRRSSWC